jgi:hypothetical protein
VIAQAYKLALLDENFAAQYLWMGKSIYREKK